MSGSFAYKASDKLTCEYMSGFIPVILGPVPPVLLKHMMRVLNFFVHQKSPSKLQKNLFNLGRHIFMMVHRYELGWPNRLTKTTFLPFGRSKDQRHFLIMGHCKRDVFFRNQKTSMRRAEFYSSTEIQHVNPIDNAKWYGQ